jgi:hypothetical protein
MKRNVTLFILSIITIGLLAGICMKVSAQGDKESTSKVTMKGEVLDLACYIGHGAKGLKHQQCALTCLKSGQPMGLLTADGKVYLLLADHQDNKAFEETKNYAALQVEITGPSYSRDGINAITVESVKKLK